MSGSDGIMEAEDGLQPGSLYQCCMPKLHGKIYFFTGYAILLISKALFEPKDYSNSACLLSLLLIFFNLVLTGSRDFAAAFRTVH